MNLIRIAIERPIAVIAAVLMVVLFGFVSLQLIPIPLAPDLRRPILTIPTSWPRRPVRSPVMSVPEGSPWSPALSPWWWCSSYAVLVSPLGASLAPDESLDPLSGAAAVLSLPPSLAAGASPPASEPVVDVPPHPMADTIANNAKTAAKFHFLLIFRTAFLPSLGGGD